MTDDAARDPGPAPRDFSEAEDRALRLWVSLARGHASFEKAVSCKISEYGMTTPQFGVLEALYHLGPLSLGDLADKLLVTGGNVTYVMDRLEDMDLVERRRSPVDRRVITAHLTDAGRERIRTVFPGHADFIRHVARHLDEDEQDTLRTLLKKLGLGVQEHDLS